MLFRLLQQRFVLRQSFSGAPNIFFARNLLFFRAIARADEKKCFARVDDGLRVVRQEALAYAIDGCIRSRLTPLAGRKWPPR
jgi:hypothetical protein